jgi:hypothetical protein
MTGRLLTAALVSLALAGCSDSPAPPTAIADVADTPTRAVSVTQNHSETILLETTNPCVPEKVEFSGKVHSMRKELSDGSIEIRTNFAGLKGVGLTTGTEYVLQQNSLVVVLEPSPPPFQQIIEFHSRVIARGSTDDFHVFGERTIIVNPFPDPPTIVTQVTRTECHG